MLFTMIMLDRILGFSLTKIHTELLNPSVQFSIFIPFPPVIVFLHAAPHTAADYKWLVALSLSNLDIHLTFYTSSSHLYHAVTEFSTQQRADSFLSTTQ